MCYLAHSHTCPRGKHSHKQMQMRADSPNARLVMGSEAVKASLAPLGVLVALRARSSRKSAMFVDSLTAILAGTAALGRPTWSRGAVRRAAAPKSSVKLLGALAPRCLKVAYE